MARGRKPIGPRWFEAFQRFHDGISMIWFMVDSQAQAHAIAQKLCGPNPNPKRANPAPLIPALQGMVIRETKRTPTPDWL